MRALNFCGLCVVGLMIAGACGGESSGNDDPVGSGAGDTGSGEGGDSSGPGPGGNEGVGGDGEAGAATASGGRASGGRGGGTAGAGGSGAVGGGGPVVGGRGPIPTGGKGNPPTGGVPGTGGVIGTAGDGSGGDCTPVSTSSTIDSCSLELSCENGYSYTSCYNQRTGSWSCECASRTGQFQTYDITGVVGLAACQTVSDICSDGSFPQIEGPEECKPQFESRTATYCELQQSCTRSLAITDAVNATIARQRYVSCSGVNAGRLDCYCNNGLNVQVEGQDGTEACDTVVELCDNPDVEPTGPVTCTTETQGAGPSYCSTIHRCSQPLEVGGGVIAVSVGTRSVSCTESMGGALCDCSDQTNYLRFFSELSASDIATCNQFAESCPAVDELGLNGPLTCAPNSQQGDVQFCNINIECSQAGTLGDQPIRAFGSINGYCQPLNGVWSCSCNSGTESASVEVEADGGWDACTELVDLCPDLVDVQIGQSGGIIKPPLPL
jgi:hypothetical protein